MTRPLHSYMAQGAGKSGHLQAENKRDVIGKPKVRTRFAPADALGESQLRGQNAQKFDAY